MAFFGVIILLSSAMLVRSVSTPTGHAISTTTSEVVISNYVSLSLSSNLTNGINFGSISSLPAIYHNATVNYAPNASAYYITISNDSNRPVDFCVKASLMNSSGGDSILLGNYTWKDADNTNLTTPTPAGGYKNMSTMYIKGRTNVAAGTSNFYRFWLNVSASQAPGTYNNTVYLQGVPTGTGCS